MSENPKNRILEIFTKPPEPEIFTKDPEQEAYDKTMELFFNLYGNDKKFTRKDGEQVKIEAQKKVGEGLLLEITVGDKTSSLLFNYKGEFIINGKKALLGEVEKFLFRIKIFQLQYEIYESEKNLLLRKNKYNHFIGKGEFLEEEIIKK